MSDSIHCPHCGKETNKYSPACEHCSAPLVQAAGAAETIRTVEDQSQALREALAKQSRHVKKCPFCAEEIQAEAIKCRFCGERIPAPGSGKGGRGRVLLAVAIVAGLCIAALGAYIVIAAFMRSGGMVGVDKKVFALSAELKRDPVKAEYVKSSVTLIGVGTEDEIEAKTGATKKYVSGTIKNTGDKRIIKLQLTVAYLDKNNKLIAEGSAWPILGAKGKPDSLNPQGSKEFRFPVTNINPEWSGKIRAKVSDIELAD